MLRRVTSRTGLPGNRPRLRTLMVPQPVNFSEVQEALRAAGVDSYSWSTWSNRPDWPKFRVLVPLAHPVPADLWEAATEWILERLSFNAFRRGLDLPVLRDIARLNFLPGAPDPGSICRGRTDGDPLAVPLDRIPPAAVPALPVAPWQAAIQAERKAQVAGGERWWTAYRVGGRPVDFAALDLPSLLAGRGLKVGSPKPYKDGTKRRCTCPFGREHSGGRDDDSAVIILAPGRWPAFHCAHSHHAHLGLADVIGFLWGTP